MVLYPSTSIHQVMPVTRGQLHGDSDPIIRLTGAYHNLLRSWAEV